MLDRVACDYGIVRALLASCAVLASCGTSPPGQTVVWVTTDMKVPMFVDTLRVDVLNADGSIFATRDHALPDPTAWPTSFGIVASRPARLRLRAFRGDRVHDLGDDRFEPSEEYTIDRRVEIVSPETGIEHVAVVLSGECMGVASSSLETCATNDAGVVDFHAKAALNGSVAPPKFLTHPGSWIGHREVPCGGTPREDSGTHDDEVCIPGGAFFMGDERIDQTNAKYEASNAPTPPHLVRMSPFFIDRYEVTVGRLNAAIDNGFWYSNGWAGPGENSQCTISTLPENQERPANCIMHEAAQAFCQFEGGDLPSEAQWEYAAVGRDEDRDFPWGSFTPTCDTARIGLVQYLDGRIAGPCARPNFNPLLPDDVGVTDDVSRDGVHDLAGNVTEWVLDNFVAYGTDCWARGAPLLDPVCTSDSSLVSQRGGDFTSYGVSVRPAYRRSVQVGTGFVVGYNIHYGFRCVRSP